MLKCSREGTAFGELAYQPHAEVIIQYKRHRHTLENSLDVLAHDSLDGEMPASFYNLCQLQEGRPKREVFTGTLWCEERGLGLPRWQCAKTSVWTKFPLHQLETEPAKHPSRLGQMSCVPSRAITMPLGQLHPNRVVLEVPFLAVLKGIDFSEGFSSRLEAARQSANLEKILA